jgi:fructose-1,6-bisphosphatase/inositol monophosphatase family enzyme
MNLEYKQYKQFAEDFARRAGAIIKENFSLGMAKEWKADNTPVTETDLKINSMLIKEVKERSPEHSVNGEEESNMNGESEYVWVCDPVDGTIPFSHGIPICAFSLALVKSGESVLGVVYDPFQDRLYSAAKGGGAFLNGRRICVSAKKDLKGAAADCEILESSQYDISDLVKHLRLKEGVIATAFCSIIYPSMLVAVGEFAFTIFPFKKPQDGAAVKIIVEEAGGKVTDLFGGEQRYDKEIKGFIASNGILHDRLVELVRELVIKR